jgi:5-methyltetrahydropteroyltriglutamate--homocysteine methyltransferase
MPGGSERILTSHVGSLPRPAELIAPHDQPPAERDDAHDRLLHDAVAEVVARQRQAGIDVVNDGEYGHTLAADYDYGAWWSYAWSRLGGIEMAERPPLWGGAQAEAGEAPATDEVVLASFAQRRDWSLFREAYADPASGAALPGVENRTRRPVCRGPITYEGGELIARDTANLTAALDAAGLDLEQGFFNALAPGSARFANEYYDSDDEMLYAAAEALREEYTAVIDAGLILQLDDPALAENWDQIVPEPSVEAYRRFAMRRVDALNHAIRGLPPERIRFHLCWGSWHGPHVTDIPMKDIVEVMLAVNAGAYSFEAANARHEHEWRVWQDVKLPEGKKILPGVVSHATNVIEHPEVVADRIVRFAEGVGRENVIASTDCGLGGRIHPQIAWAKLEALSQGAAIATKHLYG